MLVVLEITVTVALLVETTAMIDGYQRARSAQLGFSTRPLLNARLENPAGVPTRQILEVLNSLPGVEAAAASTSVTYHMFPLIVIGMLLTTAGLYGVLAFAVSRRSRELAVRMAIGASGRDVARLISGHSLRLVAAGSLLGVGTTFGLARMVRAAGGGGSIFNPHWQAFVLPVLIVLAIGAVATWIPSRRARKIDPAVVLRST